MIRTLLVDNHDSFTWNLVHDLIRVNGAEPVVVPNDWDGWADEGAELLDRVDNVVISPGPGTPLNPDDVGIGPAVIAAAVERNVPVLGICLGHQLIAHLYGATVGRADEPVHGRSAQVDHDGKEIFRGLPSPFEAVRYHSLAVTGVPEDAGITVTAHSEDGTIMGLTVPGRLLWGVQFHPESINTGHGAEILANFADLTREHSRVRTVRDKIVPLTGLSEADTRALSAALFRRHFADATDAVWLDGNSVGDPRARFSVMGAADGRNAGPSAAVATADVDAGTVTLTRRGETQTLHTGVLDWLQHDLDRWNIRGGGLDADLAGQPPFSFQLGWVGYLGYGVKAQCCDGEGGPNSHTPHEPDAAFVFLDRAVVIDHQKAQAHLLTLDRPLARDVGPWATADETKWAEQTAAVLRDLVRRRPWEDQRPADIPVDLELHDRASYTEKVRQIQELIRAGETYEACLTTTVSGVPAVAGASLLEIYESLRAANPAPFASYLQLPGVTVMSTSPERFLRVDAAGAVTSSPIKGTRPVGATEEEDLRIRADLQSSEKDRAENLMIVDLVRHDLGRVAAPGTVQVPALFTVESYATVHQLVSTVTARLGDGNTGVDAVRAAFPPGSMTGAPKERTMRLLEELEDGPRGVYSGAVGYFSLDGAVDLAVVIRTLVSSDGQLRYGVGGAVVAQSDPDGEYEETLVKMRAVRQRGSR
ncbi:aminodeoxychorismate synthase component I [Corynebacterium terpenotabidum]|uniref:aminodeoxychorismate synthase n=1 Tax=Corynebacterium terpenotabidum Y-11 TaxID=1200352 RepID=S4XAL6_9CORY|nr:aminodeoxychorismate synthase component I [Corynebacterium terpenotabidum]AGP30187.1 para-aminobenzoate synthase component I/II [Corynebacterium terpenotabidum Y-11]